jgi:putative ABC transport system permease protein
MIVAKLAYSNFTNRRSRTALTLCAIALSVSLIISVTSGYASIEAAILRFFSMYMGSFDAQITHTQNQRAGVPGSVAAQLNADPDVRSAVGRLETDSALIGKDGKSVASQTAIVVGVDPVSDVRIKNLAMHEGSWFKGTDGNVAVIDQVAQKVLGVKLGEQFAMPGAKGNLHLTVVGVVHKPAILASSVQTVYMPLATLQHFLSPENPDQVTRITIQLNTGVDPEAFAKRWTPKLAAIDPLMQLKLTRENKKQLDQMLGGVRILSTLGSAVAMLAATFIMFSALSMGVMERQRTLAMLRAVGAAKTQLGALVVTEGLFLAVAGLAIGIPLGYLWVWILGRRFHELFPLGVVLSISGVLFAVICSLLSAVIASLLPAISAMRLSPLEAMTPMASAPPSGLPWRSALCGLILISLDPLLLYQAPAKIFNMSDAISKALAFFGHFAVGLPAVMIGFFLLAPIFVWSIERFLGPVMAWLLGLPTKLLREQLSGSGLWRSAGTCTALMIGLSILVVMQTQGNSSLSGWKLPDKFPDVFIGVFSFGGVPAADMPKMQSVAGIKNHELMPIAIATPGLGGGAMGVAAAALMPDATMFFGVDPDIAFKLMELDFRDGNARDAERMLKLGRHVIVTEEFHELKGLHVGSTLSLKTTRHGTVDYIVAGVVWSPGIDVIVTSYDMGRQFDQRTAASVFGTLADAKEDFGVDSYHLIAANLNLHQDKEEVLDRLEKAVGVFGMKIGDVRQIKHDIDSGFRRLLLLVSTVAFAAMGVASLGVTNTVIASVRSRQWQFGILRSIGLTRSALLRLVLAEATLIGLIGCGLGLTAGIEMSQDAHQLTVLTLGYNPPLAVPWGMILLGTVIVMGLSMLASFWPALTTARSEPLSLLQAGRAAA